MKKIILSTMLMLISLPSFSAGQTFCDGLNTQKDIDTSMLSIFDKEICTMQLLECYSAYNTKEECEEIIDFGLVVIDPEITTREPSNSTSYGFEHATTLVSSVCDELKYGYDMSSDNYLAEIIPVSGAYIQNTLSCARQASIISYSSKSGMMETDYRRGPKLGSYSITYSDRSTKDSKKIIFNVKDTIAPTISAGNLKALYYEYSIPSKISISDNYLPGYSSIKVVATLNDQSGRRLSSSNLSHIGNSVWSGVLSKSSSGDKIKYSATDSSGNTSTAISGEVIAKYK